MPKSQVVPPLPPQRPLNRSDALKEDLFRDRLPIKDAIKAVGAVGKGTIDAIKAIWKTPEDKKDISLATKIALAPFKFIASVVTAAAGVAAGAVTMVATAVTHGVIKGTFDVAKGVAQVVTGHPTERDPKTGAELPPSRLTGLKNIAKGVTKVVVGAAIAGSTLIAVGSGVGVPALAGIGAAAAGAVQAVPYVGTALSTGINVVAGGAALAGTQVAAGLGAAAAGATATATATAGLAGTIASSTVAATATVGSTIVAPLAAAGVTAGTTATLAAGASAIGLGAVATLGGAYKIKQKISGDKPPKAELSELEKDATANVQQPAASQASNDTVELEGIVLTSSLGRDLAAVQQQSEQQKKAPPVSDVVNSVSAAPQTNRTLESNSTVQLTNEQANQIRASLTGTSTTFNYDTDKKPTFIGKDPVSAAAKASKDVPELAAQTWTLKVKAGTTEERIGELLSKAGDLKIDKVKIGDEVREVKNGKMGPSANKTDVAADAAPAANANAAPTPQDEADDGTTLKVVSSSNKLK